MFKYFYLFQGQLKVVHPQPIGSPPPAWWIQVFVGGLLMVDYEGQDFLQASRVEVHKDLVKETTYVVNLRKVGLL